MPWGDPLVLALAVLALGLAYLNGLHDASNAVSTAIASRALSERTALAVAAVLNLLGALVGLLLAPWTAARALDVLGLAAVDLAEPQVAGTIRIVVVSAVIATILWGVATWWWGMPSSTWHAMYSAIAGACLALDITVPWTLGTTAVLGSLLLSPLLGGLLAYALVHGIARLSRWRSVRNDHLRAAQTVSAGAVAAAHGLHDSLLPLSMLVVVLATVPGGDGTSGMPLWLGALVAVALAVGTLSGGHRIIRTLARRLTDLSTAQGLAAESSAAIVLLTGVAGFGFPISTSHTVTAGIVSSGLAVGPRSVRWGVVRQILATWIATPLVAGLTGAGCAGALALL